MNLNTLNGFKENLSVHNISSRTKNINKEHKMLLVLNISIKINHRSN